MGSDDPATFAIANAVIFAVLMSVLGALAVLVP